MICSNKGEKTGKTGKQNSKVNVLGLVCWSWAQLARRNKEFAKKSSAALDVIGGSRVDD